MIISKRKPFRRRRPFIARGDVRRFRWLFVLFVFGYLLAVVWQSFNPTMAGGGPSVAVYDHRQGETIFVDLEQYVLGVVAAEMPPTFHIEALRAQAVAARTYALYTLQHGDPLPEAPTAKLSTDHRSAQAWVAQDDFWDRWGAVQAARYWRRLAFAVESTYGQVLTYNGEPILAVYHSSSGGHTENSENYWSGSVSYLQGRPDPYDDVSPYNNEVAVFSYAAVFEQLDVPLPVDGTMPVIRVEEEYPSGRVAALRAGDTVFSGRDVREALNLRSSMFTVSVEGENVQFIQRGYGHGIGMSQYGAHGMAQQGYTYDRIVRYYYNEVELSKWYE